MSLEVFSAIRELPTSRSGPLSKIPPPASPPASVAWFPVIGAMDKGLNHSPTHRKDGAARRSTVIIEGAIGRDEAKPKNGATIPFRDVISKRAIGKRDG